MNNLDPLLYGHGNIQGITSVSATRYGDATIWVRNNNQIKVIKEKFIPFVVIGEQKLLEGLTGCSIRELSGDLEYKWLVEIQKFNPFISSLLLNYNKIYSDSKDALIGLKDVYSPNFAEQYLIQSGNTYYKGMRFDDVVRMQIDIETTGLDQTTSKIFAIAIKCSSGLRTLIHGEDEYTLLYKLNSIIKEYDPDVIENHNIFRFDLPFLEERYRRNAVTPDWGRRRRDTFEHEDTLKIGDRGEIFTRINIEGREIVDTLLSARRYDSTAKVMNDQYGLKHVAKCLGVARDDDAYIEGDKIYSTYKSDPKKVEKYALSDVDEVDAISKLLHQDKFSLSQMVPMRFQKICTAGTGKTIEYPLVRAYLKQNHSLPRPAESKAYEGALVEIQKVGLFDSAIKIDVASMYPSIILNNGIGPRKDPLGIFTPFLSKIKENRLEYKRKSKTDSSFDPLQRALKIVINSTYGYLGSEFGLFNNPEGAEKTTALGRQILTRMLEAITKRGGRPIEADTDGILCEYPSEKHSPQEFAKLIQEDIADFKGIEIESETDKPLESLYVYAMKSYAILQSGKIKLTGSAFKSKQMEPLFQRFINDSITCILKHDLNGFLESVKSTHSMITNNKCSIDVIKKKTTLQMSVSEYKKTKKKELAQYEVMIKAGLDSADTGTRSEYYHSKDGTCRHISQFKNDYSVPYYLESFKSKLKMFRFAFEETLFQYLMDFDFEKIILNTPFTNYTMSELPSDIKQSPLSHYQRLEILSKIDNIFHSLNDAIDIECSFDNLTTSEDRAYAIIQLHVYETGSSEEIIHDNECGAVTLGNEYQEYTFKVKCSYGVKFERIVSHDYLAGFGGLNINFYNDLSKQISERLKIPLKEITELSDLDFP